VHRKRQHSQSHHMTAKHSLQIGAAFIMSIGGVVARGYAEPTMKTGALTPAALVAAYPDALAKIDGQDLTWRDGTRMQLDDGRRTKTHDEWLADPDIEDMLHQPYPLAGTGPAEPARDSDPGRARNAAFFNKIYGDCRKGEVKAKLETITWLPSSARQKLQMTSVNGAAKRLEAVSLELEKLPPRFHKFLAPAGGTYNCRVIAGTDRTSAHGWGIAIDIAVAQSDYWRWAPGGGKAPGRIAYRNRIPLEIVEIFERHGFIWGGRWYHYDTMHFEYRPELLPPLSPLPDDPAKTSPARK
jgi:hypothetical protein